MVGDRAVTASAVGPDRWMQGYMNATDTLNALPGPLLAMFVPKLLNIQDDPDDDPAFCAGYRQALADALAGVR